MSQSGPFGAYNFSVEIGGVLVGFAEVTGLESQLDVADQAEGGVNGFVHKLPGRVSYTNLVLRRGFTTDKTLWEWYEQTARGIIERRNGTILLHDGRQSAVMGWTFRNGLPVRWSGPAFDATSDQVGFESIELVHEGLARCDVGASGG